MIRVDPRDPLEINFSHAEYAENAEAMRNGNTLIWKNTRRRTLHLRHRPDGKHKQSVCASANFAYSA